MSQTSVDVRSGRFYDGQITKQQDFEDGSALNEDAAASKIGYTVIAGTDPNTQSKKPVASFTFDDFLGVIYSAVGISEKSLNTGDIDIVTNQRLAYARKGYVAVKVLSAGGLTIVKGENVYFASVDGGDSTRWTYRNTTDDLTGLSYVISTGVVTVTSANHGFSTGDTVLITAATESALVGLQTITVTGAGTFTFTTAAGDSSAADMAYTRASKCPAMFMESATVAAGVASILEIKINADMSIGVE